MGIANDLSSDGRPRQHAPNVMRGRLNPTTRVVRAQGSTTQTRTPTPRSRIRTTHPRQLPREPRTWPQSDTNTALCLPLPGVLPLAAPATPRRRFAFFVQTVRCMHSRRNPTTEALCHPRGGWLLQRWGLYYALHCMLSANNQMHALPTQSHDSRPDGRPHSALSWRI